MQDDQRDSSPPPSRPTSRRPLTRYDERGRSRDPVSSSQYDHRSSQSWTQPTHSYSSHSSQEYDPQFQIPSHDPQDTSLGTSYPQGHVSQPPTQYPTQSQFVSPPHPSTRYQESGSSRAHPQTVETSYLLGPFSKPPETAPPLIGPPLPWSHIEVRQIYPELHTSPRESRQHYTRESPPRGRTSTSRRGSRGRLISPSGESPRHTSPRERVASDPYPTRRPSQSRVIDPNVPPYPPAPSPPRTPSRPPTSFPSSFPYPEVRYGYLESLQYPPERVSGSRIPHPGSYPSLSHPPSLSQQQPLPSSGQGSLSPYLPAQTFSQPQPRGAQPLPGPGELSDIRSSYSIDAPPAPLPLPPQIAPAPHPQHPSRHRRPRIHAPPLEPPAHHIRERRHQTPLPTQTKRRKPPEPYTSYAIMLADEIRQHKRGKLTLQDLYILLKRKYPDHFPDDGIDDSKDTGGGGGWRNTVRHALSVNKWFKKQYRTDADAKLDETNPDHMDPPPIDNDSEQVAPATERGVGQGRIPGGSRPLKGGYWFIREKYRAEVEDAIAKDKARDEQTRREIQEEERARRGSYMQLQRGQTTRQETMVAGAGAAGAMVERSGSVRGQLEPPLPEPPVPSPWDSEPLTTLRRYQ